MWFNFDGISGGALLRVLQPSSTSEQNFEKFQLGCLYGRNDISNENDNYPVFVPSMSGQSFLVYSSHNHLCRRINIGYSLAW